jgi:hypothetical protein
MVLPVDYYYYYYYYHHLHHHNYSGFPQAMPSDVKHAEYWLLTNHLVGVALGIIEVSA